MIRYTIAGLLSQVRGFSGPAKRLLLFSAGLGLGHGIYGLLFNLYLKKLGYDEGFVGYLGAISSVMGGAMALVAGLVSDRFGRWKMLVLGASIEALTILGVTCFTTRTWLVGLYVLLGVGFPLWLVSYNPFMAEHSREEERSQLFSVANAIWLITAMVANTVGGVLPALYGRLVGLASDSLPGYRFGLVVSFGLYLAGIVMLMAIRGEGREASVMASRRALFPLPPGEGRKLLVFTVVTALLACGSGQFFGFINLYFKEHHGASPALVGVILTGAQICGLAGLTLTPTLVRRLGKVLTVTLLQLGTVPFLIGLGLAPTLGWGILAWYGRYFLGNASGPAFDTFQMEAVPERLRATLNSLAGLPSGLAFNLFWGLSSALAGQLIVRYGYPMTYFVAAPCYLAASLLYYFYFRRYEVRGSPVLRACPKTQELPSEISPATD